MTKRLRVLLSFLSLSLLISSSVYARNEIETHFIDVGQGDSILICATNENITILIDAGEAQAGHALISYLKRAGVKKIDYLIATHPHADHIGGLPVVIKEFSIGKIYMPRTTHTTQTYENLLLAIKEKGLRITEAKAGIKVTDLPNLQAILLGPVSTRYDNLNDYSAVLLLKYYNTSFIFTGDAEAHSENDMINSGISLKADVLKVGHHGSRTSTSSAFLRAINPKIAVIMCGQGNRYGHPHDETLRKLQQRGSKIYRTDLHGNIIITSDGNNLDVKTEKKGILTNANKKGREHVGKVFFYNLSVSLLPNFYIRTRRDICDY